MSWTRRPTEPVNDDIFPRLDRSIVFVLVALYKNLYVPAIDHARPPVSLEDDPWNVVKLEVAGVRVRIVEEMYSLMITVEGNLPHETVAAIAKELRDKLAMLGNSSCQLDWIES